MGSLPWMTFPSCLPFRGKSPDLQLPSQSSHFPLPAPDKTGEVAWHSWLDAPSGPVADHQPEGQLGGLSVQILQVESLPEIPASLSSSGVIFFLMCIHFFPPYWLQCYSLLREYVK